MGDYGLITLTAYYFLCQGVKTSDSPKYRATRMVILVDNPLSSVTPQDCVY